MASTIQSKKSTTKRASSGISMKRNRSSSSNTQRSAQLLIEETFEMQFAKFCRQFKSWMIPKVHVIPYEPLVGVFPEMSHEECNNAEKRDKGSKTQFPTAPVVLAIFDQYEIQTVLNTVIMKHFKVDRSMLIALRKTFLKFDTVGTLKLEFCQLNNLQLRTLKTVLQRNELITDLSINGNPNRYQNFYILFKNTKLSHISLKCCELNDRGVQLIALQLSAPVEQTLISLNISSNFITDEGALSISSVLRVNRKLLSLNLADNWLSDVGCRTLMDVLRRFPLRHDEIVIRRQRVMERLLKMGELTVMEKMKFLQGSDTSSQRSYNRKLSRDSITKTDKDGVNTRRMNKGHSSAGSIIHRKDSAFHVRRSSELDMERIKGIVAAKMGTDQHPFVANSTPEDKSIYCDGNFKLMNLNLAYNKISVQGLRDIQEMLLYQHSKQLVAHGGLSHINLEGNLFAENSTEMDTINDYLQGSFSKRLSKCSNESRSSKRKRSGVTRVSIVV